jgi:hypothetical protein
MWSIDQHKSRGYLEAVVKKGDMEFYFAERTSKEPVFLIALASNASLKPLTSITDSWLTDASNALFNDKDARIHTLESHIQHSIPMQLVNRYQRVIEKLLRRGTCRRYYELMLSGIRAILNEGWKSFFRQVTTYLRRKRDRVSKQP